MKLALDIKGLAVFDVDGEKLGDVVDFYFDARTSQPEWLVVKAGVLAHKDVLVPMEDISGAADGLVTPYPREMIMQAPHVDDPTIDRRSEKALYEYYHLRRELPGRKTDRPAFEQDRSKTGDGRLRSWEGVEGGGLGACRF